MKNKKTMIASIILSCLSILMLTITPDRSSTIGERISIFIETLVAFGLSIIINMLLLMYINKLWTNVLYIVLMIIIFIGQFIFCLWFYIFVPLDIALVSFASLTLLYLLTIILVITAIVKFVKSRINR